MSHDFYDPLLERAGRIAEEYAISISDVMGLLQGAGRNEARVRDALSASVNSDAARDARIAGRQFDLVEHARALLNGVQGQPQ